MEKNETCEIEQPELCKNSHEMNDSFDIDDDNILNTVLDASELLLSDDDDDDYDFDEDDSDDDTEAHNTSHVSEGTTPDEVKISSLSSKINFVLALNFVVFQNHLLLTS